VDIVASVVAVALGLTAWGCAYVSCFVGFFSTIALLAAYDAIQARLC
jgi:hypothetical protein